MAATGILARVLPGADAATLAPLVHAEAAVAAAPRWQRRLAALGWRPERAGEWTAALRLSRADARALAATAAALAAGDPPAAAAWRLGPDAARDAALVRAAGLGARRPPASRRRSPAAPPRSSRWRRPTSASKARPSDGR